MKKIVLKNRLPEWLRQDIPDAQAQAILRSLKKQRVNTVCLEARCPNWARCFTKGRLAFMILGSQCSRHCSFCAVGKSQNKTLTLDKEEPYRIVKAIKELRLDFIIITSVSRDDLSDAGAGQFARTISLIREFKSDIKIEVLIPDFLGIPLSQIVSAHPDVLAHNLETVPRLYPRIRPEASYKRSLQVLRQTKELSPHLITKSSLLLGMGEEEQEVNSVMEDLRKVNCDILVLGQYLAPSSRHYPVKEFITIEQFQRYREIARGFGFKAVLASPLARTSYQAQGVFNSVSHLL